MFLRVLDQNQSHARVVELWASSTPHHLQYISYREINITFGFSIIIFCSFNNDKMGGEINAPRQSSSGNQYLNKMGRGII